MGARIEPMGAMLIALTMLAACSAPPTSPSASSNANVAKMPTATDATEAASPPSAQIDVNTLPQNVRDFILKQRMCRHFSRAESEGGNPAMARVMCAGADETTWKALVRKYQGNDAVASVLLAERPVSEAAK